MKTSRKNGLITISVLSLVLIASGALFVISPTTTEAEKVMEEIVVPNPFEKRVVVNLQTNTVTLLRGTSTIKTLAIVSQGKPGSYYETPGGDYKVDYKKPLHFSSFGLVYMPHNIHIFGNYFIHGIPYYPDGTKVSSSYSGGCIRLEDNDAKTLYAFVDQGTIVTITRGNTHEFTPTEKESRSISSLQMTALMVATISLEVLKQDDTISLSSSTTTRKDILPALVKENNMSYAILLAKTLGEEHFVSLMNTRAATIGLSNTIFTDVTSPVKTSYEDYLRFMNYITTYKSFLLFK